METKSSIYEAIVKVMSEIGAVGKSKKNAEQEAAKAAINNLNTRKE